MQVLKAVPGYLDPSHLWMVLHVSLGKAYGGLTNEDGFCFSFYPSFPGLLSWSRWHLSLAVPSGLTFCIQHSAGLSCHCNRTNGFQL